MEDIKYTVFVFALDTIGEVWEPIANMKHHRDIEAYPGPIEIERRFKFSSAAEEEASVLIVEEIAKLIPKNALPRPLVSHFVGPSDNPIEYLLLGFAAHPMCKIFFVVERSVAIEQTWLRVYGVNYEAIGQIGASPICNLGVREIEELVKVSVENLDPATVQASEELKMTLARGAYQLSAVSGRSIE